jgi:hydroxypyruvate isomerase
MTLRYAANLSMLYTEVLFLDRFASAAAAGFAAVEFLFPYEAGVGAIRARSGEWGTLGDPARRDCFRRSFAEALEAADRLHCRRLNALFGNEVVGLEPSAQIDCAVENLGWAAPQAARAGVTLLVEPLNPIDFPRYFLHTTAVALDIVAWVDHPAVRLQYDVYHAQMTEGNLIHTITTSFPYIGHVQIADVPGRHEPGTGEIDFPAVFSALDRLGYPGYIGLEYRPSSGTDASLSWLPREAKGRQ